jgi:hypothetical protein
VYTYIEIEKLVMQDCIKITLQTVQMSMSLLEKVPRSLRRFEAVIEIFGDEYLRSPNQNDITQLLAFGKE